MSIITTILGTDQATNSRAPINTNFSNLNTDKAEAANPVFTGTVTLPTGLTGVVRADAGVVSVDTDVTDIVAAASLTTPGKVELATGAETITGTDATRAVTPDGLDDWDGSPQITQLGTIGTGVWNGTAIPIAYGGTGAALADPNADRILFWDDSLGAFTYLTAGTGLTITGTTITSAGGGLTWTEVTGTSQTMAVNNAYIANNAGLVTLTLPDTAAVGDVVRVVGKGAGLWRIAQNASEIIYDGNKTTATGTGGYIEATHRRDCVELVCVVANTEWTVMSSKGNITYNP